MAYDFSGLTTAQHGILTFRGYVPGSLMLPKPQRRTVDPLIRRGLLIEFKSPAGVAYYEVPNAVHIAWCDYCSRHA